MSSSENLCCPQDKTLEEVKQRLQNIKDTLAGEELQKEDERLKMRRKEKRYGNGTGGMEKKESLDFDIPMRELDLDELNELFQQR